MSELDEELEVDLTPLIDVIFMLIIFFIMTMSFTLPVVDFNLPQSSTAQVTNRTTQLRVKVTQDGVFSVGEEPLSKEAIASIVQNKANELAKKGEDLTIELVIDKNAPSQYLIDVADLAREYTKGRLSIISDKVDPPKGTISRDANADVAKPKPETK